MAESPEKKTETQKAPEDMGEDYELMSHTDIMDLRDELRKLKMHPNEKTLQLSMVELAGKVDKLIDIFGEAMHEIRVEEGGLTFADKMRPLVDRMDKILEQNSQIAEGLVAIADLVSEMKDMMGGGSAPLPSVNHPPAPGAPPPARAPPPGAQTPPPIPPPRS